MCADDHPFFLPTTPPAVRSTPLYSSAIFSPYASPIADIDRHAMTPPISINRLSAAVFVDAGRAWDNGAAKPKYYRGVGVELLGEIRLIYLATLPVRLGIARGMDYPGEVQGYLRLGLGF